MSKRYITLLEIMIVIFLIGIISSVVGYNMKGSLEKGKVFKTEQAQRQLQDILLFEVARGEDIEKVILNPKKYLDRSGLVKDSKELLKDGWGKEFKFDLDKSKTNIEVYSESLDKYKNKKSPPKNLSDEEDDY